MLVVGCSVLRGRGGEPASRSRGYPPSPDITSLEQEERVDTCRDQPLVAVNRRWAPQKCQ
jgi:hypothetical protein